MSIEIEKEIEQIEKQKEKALENIFKRLIGNKKNRLDKIEKIVEQV